MKLQWSDIEAHRAVLTDVQFERLRAYYVDGKSVNDIAAAEGKTRNKGRPKTSVGLSIGRASTAILSSLLGRRAQLPPTVPSASPGTEGRNAEDQTA